MSQEENNEDNQPEVEPNANAVLNEKFINDLLVHFRSAVPALVVDVHDRRQFVKDVKTAAERVDASIVYWDGDEGLHYFPNNGINARQLGSTDTTHPVEAMKVLQEMIMEGKVPQDAPQLGSKVMFLMRNFEPCWSGMAWGPGRPMKVMEQIINLTPFFENRTCSFVFYGPHMKVPETLSDDVQRIDYTFPGTEALNASFELIYNSVKKNRPNTKAPSSEIVERAIQSTQGLYTHKAKQAFTLAIVRNEFDYNNDSYINDVAAERRKYIKESGLVDLLIPRGGFETIGGLSDAKQMVTQDLAGLRQEARDFGMDKPNGILCGGPPGSGKSAFAMAVGGEFGMDILAVSPNKILHSHLGKSEENLAKILKLPELYQGAGCILYFEECDKLFGSFNSKGDDSTSGTGLRLLGTMLTYFQDRQYNPNDCAYIMGTFNNGNMMDDALLRPGRFNSKAWIGLPDANARAEIISIHLAKRSTPTNKRNPEDYPLDKLVKLTDKFSGAELEAAVVSMVKLSYANQLTQNMEGNLLIECAKSITPQATMAGSEFEKQTAWAKESGFLSQCASVTKEAAEERGIVDMPNMVKIDEKKLKKNKIK